MGKRHVRDRISAMDRVRSRWSVIALTSTLVACGIASPSGPEDSLRGVVWELQSFGTHDEGTISVPDPERYTVEFSDEEVVEVRADCNVCSGPYRASGSSLTLGPPPPRQIRRGSGQRQSLRPGRKLASHHLPGRHDDVLGTPVKIRLEGGYWPWLSEVSPRRLSQCITLSKRRRLCGPDRRPGR